MRKIIVLMVLLVAILLVYPSKKGVTNEITPSVDVQVDTVQTEPLAPSTASVPVNDDALHVVTGHASSVVMPASSSNRSKFVSEAEVCQRILALQQAQSNRVSVSSN